MNPGRRSPWLAVTLLSVVAVIAACSPSPSPSPVASATVPSAPTASVSAGPIASGEATPAPSPAETMTLQAYFYLGGELGTAGLVPVIREVPKTQAVGAAAIEALLAGPTAEEGAERVITSAVPDGSRLLGLTIENGVATVDLSSEFESGGGSLSVFVRLAQVVYTLTQFPTVSSVSFEIEGRAATVFSSEGLILDRPVGRDDFTDQLPAIFVDQPAWSADLGNPARITGTANVFEAQFLVTILDGAGARLAEVPVMATCGTGCRGTFDVTVPYTVSTAGWGTLRVWDGSAKDGSPENVREYPVWLTPAG
jgi:hypothetical protein